MAAALPAAHAGDKMVSAVDAVVMGLANMPITAACSLTVVALLTRAALAPAVEHSRILWDCLRLDFFRPAQIQRFTARGAASSLAVLCCWLALAAFAAELWRAEAPVVVSGRKNLELVLNKSLANVTPFEFLIWEGRAIRLLPQSFSAEVPLLVTSLLSEDLPVLIYYSRSMLMSMWLWWRGDTWWNDGTENLLFGSSDGGLHEFEPGQLVYVPTAFQPSDINTP
eukprot:COSAG05_NODE_7354_length_823_cov_1.671271_1_plen_224_part_01